MDEAPVLPKELSELKSSIDQALHQWLQQKTELAQQIGDVYADLIVEIAKLVKRGGKRLRPALTIFAYRALGGQNQAGILQAAVAQELFHAFLLMHDDIIDRDQNRWGGPNISGQYLKRFRKQLSVVEAYHFADCWALLAGDVCLGLATDALLNSGFVPSLVLTTLQRQQDALFQTIGGELSDVSASLPISQPLTYDKLIEIYHFKTAVYSFQTPLLIGVSLAEAADVNLRVVRHYSAALGIVFQLRDDWLGLFGNPAVTGKSNLSDLQEGKMTVLMNYGYQLSNLPGRQLLNDCLGNQHITHEQLMALQDLLRACGAETKNQALAESFASKAKQSLPTSGFDRTSQHVLADLVDFALQRQA